MAFPLHRTNSKDILRLKALGITEQGHYDPRQTVK